MNTEIIVIVDRSGSMWSIASDAIGGFNSFLSEQQAVEGEGRMTVVLFDDKYEPLYEAKPLSEADPLTDKTFVPRGGTALMDAIGKTLNVHRARIKEEGWVEKVIVCILTDGAENQSREYNSTQIKEMITAAEADDWSFVFLAANQDAFAVSAAYGINPAFVSSFSSDSTGTRSAYSDMSLSTKSLRGA